MGFLKKNAAPAPAPVREAAPAAKPAARTKPAASKPKCICNATYKISESIQPCPAH